MAIVVSVIIPVAALHLAHFAFGRLRIRAVGDGMSAGSLNGGRETLDADGA